MHFCKELYDPQVSYHYKDKVLFFIKGFLNVGFSV